MVDQILWRVGLLGREPEACAGLRGAAVDTRAEGLNRYPHRIIVEVDVAIDDNGVCEQIGAIAAGA
ncbi:hypothetical protein D3C72_1800300 [compost metagenome]